MWGRRALWWGKRRENLYTILLGLKQYNRITAKGANSAGVVPVVRKSYVLVIGTAS